MDLKRLWEDQLCMNFTGVVYASFVSKFSLFFKGVKRCSRCVLPLCLCYLDINEKALREDGYFITLLFLQIWYCVISSSKIILGQFLPKAAGCIFLLWKQFQRSQTYSTSSPSRSVNLCIHLVHGYGISPVSVSRGVQDILIYFHCASVQ